MIDYYLVTKPGIILGNLITFAAGFLLAAQGRLDLVLFITSFAGLGLIIASGCVFNNYIDRFIDQKMERTKDRAFCKGSISSSYALVYATALVIAGNLLLYFYTNIAALLIADLGFVIYVAVYTMIKGVTHHSTLIGSISGAVPPVVGYCVVAGHLDITALLLFLVMVFWQMPHFFAIALWRFDDYAKAGIPVMPVARSPYRTKVEMLIYIVGLLPMLALLGWYGKAGMLFVAITLPLACVWLYYSLQGFKTPCDVLWGKKMFRFSLVLINVICLVVAIEAIV